MQTLALEMIGTRPVVPGCRSSAHLLLVSAPQRRSSVHCFAEAEREREGERGSKKTEGKGGEGRERGQRGEKGRREGKEGRRVKGGRRGSHCKPQCFTLKSPGVYKVWTQQ